MTDQPSQPAKPAKPARQLTTKKPKTPRKSGAGRVEGRLKEVLDLMIWSGKPWDVACREIGMTTRNMRLAMSRPHVLGYLRRERGVRLVAASTQNLSRLEELRDQNENINGAVSAARTIETMTNEAVGLPGGGAGGPGGMGRAGYMIDLRNTPQPGLQIIVHHPGPIESPPAGWVVVDDGEAAMIDITPKKVGE